MKLLGNLKNLLKDYPAKRKEVTVHDMGFYTAADTWDEMAEPTDRKLSGEDRS